ncbi:Rhodanese-like domain-containing protein [Cercophora newfieldiana]|uniref:Rhodanese-like domain-containing protein n=1 Tax=Cercophora newfieldiana TaxID=92897 RepID=A0AA40CSD8_9PEZI|nr:Rhodanese-like domain-containing protein [Cercophora newfieldiana]
MSPLTPSPPPLHRYSPPSPNTITNNTRYHKHPLRKLPLIMSTTTQPPPWHAAYPAPKTTPASMTRAEVLALMDSAAASAGKNYILVDLRRNDHEGGTIRGSVNLPAQSLYPALPTVYTMFKAAGIKKVLWYCGSSSGRGTRAAGWFADYLAERGDLEMRSLVLDGGIKGWVKGGSEFVARMDEYDAAVWAAL